MTNPFNPVVTSGTYAFAPTGGEFILNAFDRVGIRPTEIEQTQMQRAVMELMAEGRSNKGIAEALVVTPAAVEKHITGIFSKLGVSAETADHRRVLAVLTFLRR